MVKLFSIRNRNKRVTKASRFAGRGIRLMVLTIGAFIFLFPLYWMVATSLKTLPEISAFPPVWWPKVPRWSNYAEAWAYLPFATFTKNTCIISVAVVIGSVMSASLVGYGFAHFRFPGRDVLFVILLSTMMVPSMVKLIPLFILFRNLGWINTFLPLTVPAYFAAEPFFVFLMRQFYRTVPKELSEAARIDGCSEPGIWWHIMVPLSKPALASVAIFSFQGVWNDFTQPLVFLNQQLRKTLALGLYSIVGQIGESVQLWHYAMAISVIMVLPMVIIFLIFQRFFVQGVVMTGIKG